MSTTIRIQRIAVVGINVDCSPLLQQFGSTRVITPASSSGSGTAGLDYRVYRKKATLFGDDVTLELTECSSRTLVRYASSNSR